MQWQQSGQPMKAFARERGVPASSLRDWALEAGVETRRPHPKRDAFEQALAAGCTPWKAHIAADVRYCTARRWARQAQA